MESAEDTKSILLQAHSPPHKRGSALNKRPSSQRRRRSPPLQTVCYLNLGITTPPPKPRSCPSPKRSCSRSRLPHAPPHLPTPPRAPPSLLPSLSSPNPRKKKPQTHTTTQTHLKPRHQRPQNIRPHNMIQLISTAHSSRTPASTAGSGSEPILRLLFPVGLRLDSIGTPGLVLFRRLVLAIPRNRCTHQRSHSLAILVMLFEVLHG
jgi:hypothetical protein